MFHAHASQQDLHAPSNQLVHNGSGAYITKGTVVRIANILEDGTPVVAPATISDKPFGIMWEDCLDNRKALSCTMGIFPTVTTGTNPNDQIYFDSSGQISITPTNSSSIGYSMGEGYIFVTIFNSSDDFFAWDKRGDALETEEAKLGSNDNFGFNIITNGQVRSRYEKNGQILHGITNVIPDFRYQFGNLSDMYSGMLVDPFSATNTTNLPLVIWNHDVPENTLQVFEVKLVSKNGTKKAVFDYTVTVSRETGLAVIKHVQTNHKYKPTDINFGVRFFVSVTNFKIEVSNPDDVNTLWGGYVICHASL